MQYAKQVIRLTHEEFNMHLNSKKLFSFIIIIAIAIAFIPKVHAGGINAAMKSLLFPGLGQKANGDIRKSKNFMLLGAGLLGVTGYLIYSSYSLWDTYKQNITDVNYNKYTGRVDQANIAIGITAAFWLYNVYDAFSGPNSMPSQTQRRPSSTTTAVKTIECPNCHNQVKEGAKFCTQCGTDMRLIRKIKCRNCKAELPDTTKFCPECGTKIEKQEDTGETEAEPEEGTSEDKMPEEMESEPDTE